MGGNMIQDIRLQDGSARIQDILAAIFVQVTENVFYFSLMDRSGQISPSLISERENRK